MLKSKTWIVVGLLLLAAALLALACEESSESADGDTPDRPECEQATDCGAEGRSFWICSPEGYCYTIYEYCYYDSECNEACVDHLCVGGKKEEVDPPDPDGDRDTVEQEIEHEQIPCEYECCTNADCAEDAFCDTERHTCQAVIPCDEDKQCCQDYDCWVDAAFGENFICKFNKCIDPNAPCPWECCETVDCLNNANFGEGYYCVTQEGDDQGTCRSNVFSCTPGDQVCCMNDPGNPSCQELGKLSSEAILTCNSAGDAYELTMCPDYHDCLPRVSGGVPTGVIDCERNGRCGDDSDCQCPNSCVETEDDKRCMLPMLSEGDVCADDRCGTGQPQLVGYCPEGSQCCVDQQTGEGTCGQCK